MQQLQIPPLAEGEIYLCGMVDAKGDVTHTILLPGDNEPATWEKQMEWAKSLGGDLLTRAELVIAYEQHRDQFESRAYWSNTPEESGWAWYQSFITGYQDYRDQINEFRARAVRRFTPPREV
jgi:hypothetical protein